MRANILPQKLGKGQGGASAVAGDDEVLVVQWLMFTRRMVSTLSSFSRPEGHRLS
jgi:hypothetical protein